MGFLAHLPELCDITFMVGPDKEPVCAVRAVLGNIPEFFKFKLVIDTVSTQYSDNGRR